MSKTTKSLRALFGCSLVAVAFAAGGAPGRALGDVYAYSENDVSFLISNGIAANVTSSTKNNSNFGGFGPQTTTDPTDAKQAFTGPSTMPPDENTFPAYKTSHGQYTRADSLLTGVAPGTTTDTAGSNVVESFRQSSNPGSDQAFAFCFVSFQFTPDGTAPIGLTLKAHPTMAVSADKPGEFATAGIGVEARFTNAANGKLLLDWTPNGTLNDHTLNDGSISGLQDPYNLNFSITAIGGPDSKGYSPGPGQFFIGYNQTVVMNVNIIWEEFLSDSVPEPSPLLLLGLGSGILYAVRWTRRRVLDRR